MLNQFLVREIAFLNRKYDVVLLMLNNTPVRWASKRQKTVETSTYCSELVASRIATELIPEVRFMLRSLEKSLEEKL